MSGLEPARWDTPTPAEGWTVRDQIAHLAYSDVSARLAVADAEAWQREFNISSAEREQCQHEAGRSRSPAELRAWWRENRRAMLDAFRPPRPPRAHPLVRPTYERAHVRDRPPRGNLGP